MSRQSSLNKILALPFIAVLFMASCSTTKFVPADDYLLKAVKIESEQSDVKASTLMPYVQQRPNSKWFSLFKVPLSLYSMSGRDSTRWGNRFLRGLGEAPVIYDSLKAAAVSEELASVLECFLDDESHALECGSCLLAEVDDALGSVAVGKEVVDEEHVVVGCEIVAADDNVIFALLGE